jgi:hypothetical protein
VVENRALERLELRTWFDGELVDEALSAVSVDLERLRLPAAAVQREHQLPADALAQRVSRDQLLQLPDDLLVVAEVQVRLDAPLQSEQPQLLEPARLVGLAGQVADRRAAPEVNRRLQGLARLPRRAIVQPAGTVVDQRFEALEVELMAVEVDAVAAGLGEDQSLSERLAQLGDVAMTARRLTVPAVVVLAVVAGACGGSKSDSAKPRLKPAAAAPPQPPPRELMGTWVTKLRSRDVPPQMKLDNPYTVTVSPHGGVDNAAVFQIANGSEPLEGESATPVINGDQITLRHEGCFVEHSGYRFDDNVYRYRISGDRLTFTVVKNSCKDRHAEAILTSHSFKRVP